MTSRTGPPLRAYTDLGNAERFAQDFGGQVRYVPPWRRWLVWDGLRWAEDNGGAVERLAHTMILQLYHDAANLKDHDEKIRLLRHAERSENNARLRALLECARVKEPIPIQPAALDTHPMRLTVANGTLDLVTGTLGPARPEDFITKRVPIMFDPGARCPRWDAFLKQVVPDAAVRGFLQKAVGYSLTGDISEQCMFLLLGVGANGKTTFVEIVRRVLGDSAHQADVATFLDRLQQGGPRNGVAGLCGMRFVTSSEIGENRRLNESLMKTLTGSEPISASRIYEREFEFHPTFKIWIAANHKPVIRGADEGIWRRLRLVPFTANIAPDKQDHHLREKLETELPGILAWAVQGCLAWQREGLGETETVTVATKQFREESDEIGQFIAARCTRDDTKSTPAGALYTAYEAWCAQNALEAMTQTKFGRNLTDRGFRRETAKDGKRLSLRMGIVLDPENAEDPEKTGDHAGNGECVTVGERLSLSTHKERDMEVTIEETRSNSLNPLADTVSESLEADQYELDERAGMQQEAHA